MGDEHFAHALARHNFMMTTLATTGEALPTVKNVTKSLIQQNLSANAPESSLHHFVCNNAPNLAVLR